MSIDQGLMIWNKKTNDLSPYTPKVNKTSIKVLSILFLILSGILITISIFSSTAIRVEKIDLPVIPNIKIEASVIVLIGIGLIFIYLRNPYKHKNCPYKGNMTLLYIPILIGIVFFVKYASMMGLLLSNIPELDQGWNTPLVIYYGENDVVLFSILAYQEMFFLILGEIALGFTMYIFVDMYKDTTNICSAWNNGEITKKKLWQEGNYKIPVVCKSYKNGLEICQKNIKI